MNTRHKCFCRLFLFFGSFSVPGTAALNFGTSVERDYVVFHRVGTFFVNVEPSFAPSLDRIRKLDVEIINVSSDTDNNAAYVIGGVVGAIAAEAENAFPQSPIRRDSEEAFAKCDENRNVKDGIGGQLVQLNPVNKKKAAEEIVNWGRKAADEVINETNPVLHWRVGVAFFAGKADGVLFLHQAKPLQHVEVLVGDFRSLPVKIFGGHCGFWSAVARKSRAWWHQRQETKQCLGVRKIKQSWVQGKFLQRGIDVRRKRRTGPRLKKGLYRIWAKQCTVG